MLKLVCMFIDLSPFPITMEVHCEQDLPVIFTTLVPKPRTKPGTMLFHCFEVCGPGLLNHLGIMLRCRFRCQGWYPRPCWDADVQVCPPFTVTFDLLVLKDGENGHRGGQDRARMEGKGWNKSLTGQFTLSPGVPLWSHVHLIGTILLNPT
jgi:hypothetical protein